MCAFPSATSSTEKTGDLKLRKLDRAPSEPTTACGRSAAPSVHAGTCAGAPQKTAFGSKLSDKAIASGTAERS